MAMWDGSFEPVVKKWHWKKKRAWWPFLQCERSGHFLFLKEAYHGIFVQDWEYDHDLWLSKEEFMLATLKDEFNQR